METALRQTLRSQPHNVDALNHLAVILQTRGELTEAIALYRRAISIRPDFAPPRANLGLALSHLGEALGNLGDPDAAIAAYGKAIQLRPNSAPLRNNFALALLDAGLTRESIEQWQMAVTLDPGNSIFHSGLISAMNYPPEHDGQTIAEAHRNWNRLHGSLSHTPMQPQRNRPDPNRRLRIGYVSRDLRSHPVGRFMLPIFENHDRELIEVVCYSDAIKEDELSAHIRAHVDQWRPTASLKLNELAALILADEVDILVDLSGHSSGNRLLVFAQKPAPVQVTYLGYPSTTGLTAIDYRLTDSFADPPGQTDKLHSEKLSRLPTTNWCFSEPPFVPIAPAPAIENGFVTFGCFNNFAKVTSIMIDLWGEILRAVPRSRLVLKSGSFSAQIAKQRAMNDFARAGISMDRLTLLGPVVDHPAHLLAHSQIDIALDTFPYHGTATTCDAMWMGVPVITLAGATHVSRVGVSLLNNAGMNECITNSPRAYVEVAISLANKTNLLVELRQDLRERMRRSPLMNGVGFTRNVESAYREMWTRWCAEREVAAIH